MSSAAVFHGLDGFSANIVQRYVILLNYRILFSILRPKISSHSPARPTLNPPPTPRRHASLSSSRRRHQHSTSLESKQLLAVLGAVLEVVRARNLTPSPTALFGALMVSLERPESRAESSVLAALLHLLSLTLTHMPPTVLRNKMAPTLDVLLPLLAPSADGTAAPSATRHAVDALITILTTAADDDDGDHDHDATTPLPPLDPAFATILLLCVDTRPKVRRQAQTGLASLLTSYAATHPPLAAALAGAIADTTARCLPEPERAALAAAQASGKQRPAMEAAIEFAVARALHWLGALKQVTAAGGIPPPQAASIAACAAALYRLHQPLLNQHVTDLLAILIGQEDALEDEPIYELLRTVLAEKWSGAGEATALARVLETGFTHHPRATGPLRGQLFQRISAYLAHPDEAVGYAAGSCLASVARAWNLGRDQDGAAPGDDDDDDDDALVSALVALTSALTSWSSNAHGVLGLGHACRASEPFLGRVHAARLARRRGGPRKALDALLRAVGGVVAHAFDQAEAGVAPDAPGAISSAAAAAASTALATAVARDPSWVLAELPLDLAAGLRGEGRARTWLLPVLKQHAKGAGLRVWVEELMPAARLLGSVAEQQQQATTTTTSSSSQAAICRALELQIFQALASFVSQAPDLAQELPIHAKSLGTAFANRPDLRPAICNALERMCVEALGREEEEERAGADGDPTGGPHGWSAIKGGGRFLADDDDEDDKDDKGEDVEDDEDQWKAKSKPDPDGMEHDDDDDDDYADGAGYRYSRPSGRSLDAATRAANRTALVALAQNFMPLLMNAFVAGSGQDAYVARAIAAYAPVADPALVHQLFAAAGGKLAAAAHDPSIRAMYTELTLALARGLHGADLEALEALARPGIVAGDSTTTTMNVPVGSTSVQKKSYKVLAYLVHRGSVAPQTVLEMLVQGHKTCESSARRFRLISVQALAIYALRQYRAHQTTGAPFPLRAPKRSGRGKEDGNDGGKEEKDDDDDDDDDDDADAASAVLTVLISEIVLALKEANKKTRGRAYDMLVELARASGDDPHALVSILLAGLVGQTPHMMSATVMALARLVYEFAPQLSPMLPHLIPAVLMLLRSKAREVIKATLGFCKVIAMRLPTEELGTYLSPLLEGILLWAADTKNRFKLKVRAIVEKLAKRCGFDAVAAHIPASDSRLLIHIRKERDRKRRGKSEGGGGGSQWGGDEGARTARASEWNASAMFDDEGLGGTAAAAAASTRTGITGRDDASFKRSSHHHPGRGGRAGGAGREWGSGQESLAGNRTAGAPAPEAGPRKGARGSRGGGAGAGLHARQGAAGAPRLPRCNGSNVPSRGAPGPRWTPHPTTSSGLA